MAMSHHIHMKDAGSIEIHQRWLSLQTSQMTVCTTVHNAEMDFHSLEFVAKVQIAPCGLHSEDSGGIPMKLSACSSSVLCLAMLVEHCLDNAFAGALTVSALVSFKVTPVLVFPPLVMEDWMPFWLF